MSISRQYLNYALPVFSVTVGTQALRAFSGAIGHSGVAGDADIAPPTFMKVIENENNSSRRMLETLGVDLKRVLHAEQQFDYAAPIRAGDCLQVQRTVVDLYEKKGGVLEFIVIESLIHNQHGTRVGTSRQVVLVRNPVAT